MDRRSQNDSAVFDRVAVALSGLCLVHCLLLPFAIMLTPFLGSIGEDHLHAQLLFVVVPVSLVALTLGYRRHLNRRVVAWGFAGLTLLFLGATLAHSLLGILADQAFTVAGSATLAITHYWNGRLSRRCAPPSPSIS